jgi:hypothetical protein
MCLFVFVLYLYIYIYLFVVFIDFVLHSFICFLAEYPHPFRKSFRQTSPCNHTTCCSLQLPDVLTSLTSWSSLSVLAPSTHSASLKFHRPLCQMNVHYRIHNSPLFASELCQIVTDKILPLQLDALWNTYIFVGNLPGFPICFLI